MFYKKKLKSLANQNAVEFSNTMDALKKKMAEIGNMTDVASHYQALLDLEMSISTQKTDTVQKIKDQLAEASRGMAGYIFFSFKAIENFKNSKENSFSFLDGMLKEVSSQKAAIIENQLLNLSQSEGFDKLCDKCPDVSAAFAKMAAKTGLDIPRIVRLDKPDLSR